MEFDCVHTQSHWAHAMATQPTVPWRRGMLVVVGEGRAGKTSLLRSLHNQSFEEHSRSTAGIAVSCVETTQSFKWSPIKKGTSEFEAAVAKIVVRMKRVENELQGLIEASDTRMSGLRDCCKRALDTGLTSSSSDVVKTAQRMIAQFLSSESREHPEPVAPLESTPISHDGVASKAQEAPPVPISHRGAQKKPKALPDPTHTGIYAQGYCCRI